MVLQIPNCNLKPKESDTFWRNLPCCEHIVQFYGHDNELLDSLESFAASGLLSDESVIIIGTPGHREALATRLTARGFDVAAAVKRDQYIALDSEETLSKILKDGWPDEANFEKVVHELYRRARLSGRKVRAFGEMVYLLWDQGDREATLRLEYLWHRFCSARASFSLFCAYPHSAFSKNAQANMDEISAAHTMTFMA